MTTNHKPGERAMRAAERIYIDERGSWMIHSNPGAATKAIARIIESEMGDVVELRKQVRALLDAVNNCQDEDLIVCIADNLKELEKALGLGEGK